MSKEDYLFIKNWWNSQIFCYFILLRLQSIIIISKAGLLYEIIKKYPLENNK